jgi:hypothetical protein
MMHETRMSVFLKFGIGIITATALAACSDLVQLKPGAEAVHVSNVTSVSNCIAHGSVHVSLMSKIGPFNRSELSVEDELADLARNSALGSGGDTVVPSGPVVDGARDFDIYVCHR